MTVQPKRMVVASIILVILGFSLFLAYQYFHNNELKGNNDTNVKETANLCKIGGCSGQLCVGIDEERTITTCEWKEEYGCYKTAKCEVQDNGKCGFTKSQELIDCLNKSGTRIY